MNVMRRCWIYIVYIVPDYNVLRRCSIPNCHSCLSLHYSFVKFLLFIAFHILVPYIVLGLPLFRFSRGTLSIRLSNLFPSNLCTNRLVVCPLYVNYYQTIIDLLSSIGWVRDFFMLTFTLLEILTDRRIASISVNSNTLLLLSFILYVSQS